MHKQTRLPRAAGILLPISALPSPYGIGTLGREAREFIDFLNHAGQRYWQVLPIGPTSYGDSPYQSFSAYAGNPYFIDPDQLIAEGLLPASSLSKIQPFDPARVDYAQLYATRFSLLRSAFARFTPKRDYQAFCRINAGWLDDYALFMAIKEYFGGGSWQNWPDALRLRDPMECKRYSIKLTEDVNFWKFCQYQFFRQWAALKHYATQNGISIIGDIPIYVALDSADVWANSRQFQLDAQRHPTQVAGVPPDLFSKTGQLWGNPLYNWRHMEHDSFSWWKSRMAFASHIYDILRIDHFIGLVRYYAIPAEAKTAANGHWEIGPGRHLLEAVSGVLNGAAIIAEDLGLITPTVTALRERAGYPGMKLMELAFDSGPGNSNLPHHYTPNTVVYGGTHDNETLAGYFNHIQGAELTYAKDYLQVKRRTDLPRAVIHAAYASVADTVLLQMQDWLGLDNQARMNHPSTLGGNWQWRMLPGSLTDELAQEIRQLTERYGRCEPQKVQNTEVKAYREQNIEVEKCKEQNVKRAENRV